MGIRLILYIDDGIGASSTNSQCCQHRDVVLSDLEKAGLVLSIRKCHLEPHQIADGLVTSLVAFEFPEIKLSDYTQLFNVSPLPAGLQFVLWPE